MDVFAIADISLLVLELKHVDFDEQHVLKLGLILGAQWGDHLMDLIFTELVFVLMWTIGMVLELHFQGCLKGISKTYFPGSVH